MTTTAASHWSEHTWKLLACVRGRKGEMDYAYVSQDGFSTLLVRSFPSLTVRRLTQTQKIQSEGDFRWIVVVPKTTKHREAAPGVEVLDEACLRDLLRLDLSRGN